jgi:hypothetical protein
MLRGLGFAGLVIFTFFFLLAMMCFAFAHDHEHPELNDWFMHLQSGKGPCCDGSEALHVADVDWESVNDPAKPDVHYRVRLDVSPTMSQVDMEWIDVPDEAVVTEPNRDGRTLVWPMRGYMGTTVRCFMPGPLT